MSTLPPTNSAATLSQDEYMLLAENAAQEVIKVCIKEKSMWSSTTYGDDRHTILTRQSTVPEVAETMLMLRTRIPAPVGRVERLLGPWHGLRKQWDDLLKDATIIAEYPNEIYLMRHLVSKRITLLFSESIDVVKVLRQPDGVVVFGSTGTTHAAFPSSPTGYRRTHQYLGGYILEPTANNETDFSILFHADLKLPKQRFLQAIADRFKPRLMIESAVSLQKAINSVKDQ